MYSYAQKACRHVDITSSFGERRAVSVSSLLHIMEAHVTATADVIHCILPSTTAWSGSVD